MPSSIVTAASEKSAQESISSDRNNLFSDINHACSYVTLRKNVHKTICFGEGPVTRGWRLRVREWDAGIDIEEA